MVAAAVATFDSPKVKGDVVIHQRKNGVVLFATFTRLPIGKHGFHIHKGGDLRGEGCKAACDHWHKGPPKKHGGPPHTDGPRHTGDLGNIEIKEGVAFQEEYFLEGVKVDELYGRAIIVHADPDDLGKGDFQDSHTTGHSGTRIGCAIIGRIIDCNSKNATRKNK